MAQWSTAERTLQAKIVYYGPAFGGKTTNLESLHRITDPRGHSKLISLHTSDDRTLFFDLLPFDLGEILGYQVGIKLFTVPGQVRYDTTRQVVLAGADAIIFVADSSAGREDQNRWSLQNLKMNMRAKRLDPATVPVLFQFNKQDLPEAVSPERAARWFAIRPERGFPAVATEGRGVLETFVAAVEAMLASLVAQADERTRGRIDQDQLRRGLERAFAPYLGLPREPAERQASDGADHDLAFREEDLLHSSVQSSVRLGERLCAETARADRLEREVEALRRLGESLRTIGASFDSAAIMDAALNTAGEVLDACAVSLISPAREGPARLDRAWRGREDPLLGCDAGRRLLEQMASTEPACVVDDLDEACADEEARAKLEGIRAVASVRLEERLLLAYASHPDGAFGPADVRFLATVASHLGSGLEKAMLYEKLAGHRDQLGRLAESRTDQLRRAYEELRGLDQMKDRFLSGLSHEMKSPLTGILSSAVALRDYRTNAGQRGEMVGSIVTSAETLTRLLDDLFRVTGLEDASQPLELREVSAEELAREAVELSGHRAVRCRISGLPGPLRLDSARLTRAVANLIDNAIKFSSGGKKVELVLGPAKLPRGRREVDGLVIAVLDDGPSVPEQDRERIFAPFEQGGNPLTAKPAGIGIGLFEARTIARQHGGELIHRSRDGGGNEFRLTIPLAPQASKRPEPVGASASDGGRR